MKPFVVTVLLNIILAYAPTPQKATVNNTSSNIGATEKDARSVPSSPIVNGGASPRAEDGRKSQGNEDAQHLVRVGELPPLSIKKDTADWGIWFFSLLLVVVGALQAWVLKNQAKIMGKHADELNKLATAAGDNAAAAKASYESMLNIERAWIQVVITKIQGLKPDPEDTDMVWIWPSFMNRGRTPARLTKIVCRQHQLPKDESLPPSTPPRLPPEPEYPEPCTISVEMNALQFPGTGLTPFGINVWATDFEAINARETFLYVYGYVEYTDIGNEHRITRFCELYWVPLPSDPHTKGFVTTVVIPPAYLAST